MSSMVLQGSWRKSPKASLMLAALVFDESILIVGLQLLAYKLMSEESYEVIN